MSFEQFPEPLPGHGPLLRAAIQPDAPDSNDSAKKLGESGRVACDPIVGVVPPNLLAELVALHSNRQMPEATAPFSDGPDAAVESTLHRALFDDP